MNLRNLIGIIITFLLFIGLFSIPFMIKKDTIEESTPEPMSLRAEKAEAFDADIQANTQESFAPPEPENNWEMNVLAIIILGLMGTMLSWTIVDKVLRDKEDVVLLSFADETGKKVMDALSNETCRKILEEVSQKDMTASQLSEKMDMSIQRVQYNLKKLQEAGLLESDSYKYSSKGKEMDVYSVTRKYFVLGPRE